MKSYNFESNHKLNYWRQRKSPPVTLCLGSVADGTYCSRAYVRMYWLGQFMKTREVNRSTCRAFYGTCSAQTTAEWSDLRNGSRFPINLIFTSFRRKHLAAFEKRHTSNDLMLHVRKWRVSWAHSFSPFQKAKRMKCMPHRLLHIRRNIHAIKGVHQGVRGVEENNCIIWYTRP